MKDAASEKKRLDAVTVKAIKTAASDIHGKIDRRSKPEIRFPIRSLSNVRYDPRSGYFEIGRGQSVRTLTVNTVKTFAQSLKMMALSKHLVETNDFATKRDAYYQSKNWEDAKFDEQGESDTVMDDIEAMFAMEGVSREQLRFIPDEHGERSRAS
jgi:DNA topoisomerase-6 subunit A